MMSMIREKAKTVKFVALLMMSMFSKVPRGQFYSFADGKADSPPEEVPHQDQQFCNFYKIIRRVEKLGADFQAR